MDNKLNVLLREQEGLLGAVRETRELTYRGFALGLSVVGALISSGYVVSVVKLSGPYNLIPIVLMLVSGVFAIFTIMLFVSESTARLLINRYLVEYVYRVIRTVPDCSNLMQYEKQIRTHPQIRPILLKHHRFFQVGPVMVLSSLLVLSVVSAMAFGTETLGLPQAWWVYSCGIVLLVVWGYSIYGWFGNYRKEISSKFLVDPGEASMVFVTLLSPKGKGSEAVKSLKELKAPEGITVQAVYFTFGRYDGLIVFEAPDVKTAMNFVMETGFATDYTVETLTAIPAKEL